MQYREAVDRGGVSFATLREICPLRDPAGEPLFTAGGQSVVFPVVLDGKKYALKCYTVRNPALKARYERVAAFRSEIVPEMRFLESEVTIVYPDGMRSREDVLLYPWVEGIGLMEAAVAAVEAYDTETLFSLCRRFVLTARRLLDLPVRHGDLKPQNIIVEETGKMRLIDFDLSQRADGERVEGEAGTVWYRPPGLDLSRLSPAAVDNYAVAVIAVSLFALSKDPSLYHRYSNGDNLLVDPRKIVRRDRLGRELDVLLADYPGYGALLDVVAARVSLPRDLRPLLDNICTEGPAGSVSEVDTEGVLRRVVSGFGLYGYADGEGRLAVGCCYGDAQPFREGVACVRLNRNWFVIDRHGNRISGYYGEMGYSAAGRIPACRDGRWGYLDTATLEPCIPFRYDYAYPYAGGCGLVREKGKMFFLDPAGGMLFETDGYDYARPFRGGYAIVGDGAGDERSYRVIDGEGRTVVRPVRQRILAYRDGVVRVREADGRIMEKALYL